MDQKGFINVGDADIYYEVTGEGEPLVLLHGHPLDSRMWEPQIGALSKEFQVIRFDMRGCGKTFDPGLPFTLYSDIYALLEQLQINNASFVGASFGSYVGVEFALAYPEMVRSLILICPGGFNPASEDRQIHFKKFNEELNSGNIDAALEINLHQALDGPEQEKGRVQVDREWLNDIYRDIFSKPLSRNMPTWLEPNPRGRTSEIQVPTLILSGELDHSDFKYTADMLASTIPNSKHVRLASSAHFPNIDSRDEVNDLVLWFLKNN